MDELDLLTEFRRDVPEISDGAVQDARRRLRAGMAEPERRTSRTRPWLWRGAAVAGLTASLVAGVTVAQNVGGQPGRGGLVLPGGPVAAAEVAQIAERAQAAAQARPDVPLTPGTWTYVKDVLGEGDGKGIGPRTRRTTTETWYTADGLRRADVGDDGKVREHQPVKNGMTVDDLDPSAFPKPGFLIGAPTDPAGMRDRVYAETDRIIAADRQGRVRSITGIDPGGDRDTVAFELIAQILRAHYVTPRQQAAMYGALAYLKGVQVLPDSTDVLGRHGQAFAIVDFQSIRQEIIFDRASYRYLGSRSLFTRDWTEQPPPPGVEGDYDPRDPARYKKGTVTGWTAKPESGAVARPGDRP